MIPAPMVDLWYVRIDSVDASTLAAVERLMTPEERARRDRFVFEKNQVEYLVTRALCRLVLASYVGRAPEALVFQRTELGRPLLEETGDLAFNLTNTVELVACAVARGHEIGVDAEPLHRADQVLNVAKRVFTDSERAGLDALPLPARRRRAVELWTLKEAYIKAKSAGFSLPVERFEVRFSDDGSRTLAFYPPLDDAPERWALATVEVEGHLLSTCAERVPGAPEPVLRVRPADLARLPAAQ
jgi:4'-phosphopantetheinyl transferase